MRDRVCPLFNGPGRDSKRRPGRAEAGELLWRLKSLRRSCLSAVNLAELLENCGTRDTGVNRGWMSLGRSVLFGIFWCVELIVNDASGQPDSARS